MPTQYSGKKLFPTTDSITEITVNRSLSDSKISLLVIGVFLVAGIFIWRLYGLQVEKGETYFNRASNNRIRMEIIPARRGLILDAQGQVLAQNTEQYFLVYDPNFGPWPETYTVPDGWDNWKKPRDLSVLWPTIIRPIDNSTAAAYLINPTLPPMFRVVPNSIRNYPLGSVTSSALGYLGRLNENQWMKIKSQDNNTQYRPNDWVGQAGIEAAAENQLRGRPAIIDHIVDAQNHEVGSDIRQKTEPGKDITLNLDLRWQEAAVQAYREILDVKSEAEKPGAIIVSNPKTGGILALASFPTYDPEAVGQAKVLSNPNSPLLNRVTAGVYPSGSVIKPYFALVALHEGVINAATTVLSTGGIRIGGRLFPDWKAGGHGLVDVTEAIAWSVNTFFYAIGGGYDSIRGLGIDTMDKYLNYFVSKPSGIEIPGERGGLVPNPEWKLANKQVRWFFGDTYNVSIGQGDLLVTPLAINQITSFIANQGQLKVPQLISGPVKAAEIPLDLSEISRANFDTVWAGMRSAVTYGSARSLSSLNLPFYGKTGTAQWSSRAKNHAWFTGFITDENNQAKVVITVLVESGGEGSAVSVPIAKRLVELAIKAGAI